jgi:hypothetical protein
VLVLALILVLTTLALLDNLALNVKRVRAASVGPHVGEGDLLRGTLLDQETTVGRAEEEDGEGAVQETLVDRGHEVACESAVFLRGRIVSVVECGREHRASERGRAAQ